MAIGRVYLRQHFWMIHPYHSNTTMKAQHLYHSFQLRSVQVFFQFYQIMQLLKNYMLFLAFIQITFSTCTNNPIRDIYTSSSFLTLNAVGLGYQYLDNSSTKPSNFATSSPASDNWCGNDTGIMGVVSEICCTTEQINTIAKQFLTKYTYGLFLMSALQIANGFSTSGQDFVNSCKFQTNYNTSALTEAAIQGNRSIWGLYYAIGKIAVASQPFAQTETCLICANDATINNFYSNNQLKVNQDSYNSMLSTLGKAAFDYNNAFQEYMKVIVKIYKEHIIDSEASAANCSTIMDSIVTNAKWCQDQTNCTQEMTTFWSNTILQYENMVDKVNGANSRLLQSRILATVGVSSGGAGISSYTGLTSQITVNGATLEELEKAFSQLLLPLITIYFFA